MPLDKQNVPLAFGHGISTKDDPKQLQAGKLTVLQNATFQVGQELKKRNGYTALSRNISGGGTISTGVDVSSYQSELVELDGTTLYSYNSAGTNWVNKGTLVNTALTTSTVIRTTTQQTIQDSAINGSFRCFVWYDSIGQLGYSVFDSTTNQSIVNNQTLSATGTVAKVLSLGTNFVIIYFDAGNILKYKTISTSTPTTLSAATTIASDINTNKLFDATVFNSRIYIAYASSSARNSMYYLDSSLVLSSQLNVGTEAAARCITVAGDASNQAWVAYSTNNTLNGFVANTALSSTVLGVTVIDGSAPSNNVTTVISGTIGTFFYERILATPAVVSASINYNFVKLNTLTLAGAAGTASTLNRGVGLASKAFAYGGVNYVWVVYQSALQNTYFLINQSDIVVAKLSPGNGGGRTSVSILPEVNVVSSGVYQTASLIKDLLASVGGNIFTQTGVQSARVSFVGVGTNKFTLGSNLHQAGGIINMYDGARVVEHGYNVYPEGVTTTLVNSGSGGGIGPGTSSLNTNQVQYSAVYEWTDNQGQIHKSAPSVPTTVIVPSANVIQFTANYTSSTPGTLTTVSSTAGMALGQTVMTVQVATSPHVPVLFTAGTISTISSSTITGSFNVGLLSGTGPINLIALTGNAYIFTTNIAGGASSGTLTYDGGAVVGQVVVGYGGNASVFPAGTTVTEVGGGTISFSSAALIDSNNNIAYYTTNANIGTITVPTLRITSKPNVSIALFRTEVNGTVFYRQSSPTSLTYNDKTVDSVSFADSTPDAVLIGNEQLYTTGEIENIEAPAISVATTFKSRAIVVPSESQLSWWFSKQVIPGSPVEFSDSFVQNVDSRIGAITAVGVLDEKIVLFGATSKYYVVGDGPAASGANNDFSQAQHITGSTGCSNQSSILEIPVGLLYQDPTKGIYLLDRSLQEQYIGQEVEAYNSDPITSAQTIPGTTSVRLTLTSGTVLIYDWFYGQWGADPYAAEVISSVISGGKFTSVQANGLVQQETIGTFTDNSSAITMSLTTGWINFAQVQGFQRVYELLILGNYKSSHSLNVVIYSDFDDVTPTQTVVIPVTSDPGNYEYRIRLIKQKCTSVKIKIFDSNQAGTGESLSLSNMAFVVGVKKGLNKLSAARSY